MAWPRAVQIEPLTEAEVASAVKLAVRILRVKPGDRGEQFASDITDDRRQLFAAKANGQVVAYGRIIELAAGEAGPGTPAGLYLSGVLVDPAWRRRGIATELTRARLRWAFARTDTVFYATGADNTASLHLHAALRFQEIKRFGSERSAVGVDVLSRLARTAERSRERATGTEPQEQAGIAPLTRRAGVIPPTSSPTSGRRWPGRTYTGYIPG
jgi:ribosomal protein S18 acetylase RimI-like enzyme